MILDEITDSMLDCSINYDGKTIFKDICFYFM